MLSTGEYLEFKQTTDLFFRKPTLQVAKELLGKYLVVESHEGATIGKIVETEAYLHNDPASHSFRGKTRRNSPMFSHGGRVYVYFIYGNHYCFNIVTNEKEVGEAVLIRALEPVKGIEVMKKRRKVSNISKLCCGPGNVSRAMGICLSDNNLLLNEHRIKLFDGPIMERKEIMRSNRIGIKKNFDKKYRFYVKIVYLFLHIKSKLRKS